MLVLTSSFPCLAATAAEPPAREIPLYAGAAPGSESWDWAERAVTTAKGLPMVQSVVRPALLYFPAERAKAAGTAMIVVPGGGFQTLMMSYEGVDVARRLNALGIDAFVLKYRLVHAGPPAAPKSTPAPAVGIGRAGAQAGQNIRLLAGADGRQAVRVVRERAAEFGVAPNRIGMIGFSAGGYVTIAAVIGPAETRPDFAAPIYPAAGPLVDAAGQPRLPPGELPLVAPAGAPPLFIAGATDDQTVGFQGSIELYTAWAKAGRPVELHLFQTGRHGFAVKGGGADHYLDRLEEWLRVNGWLTRPAGRE